MNKGRILSSILIFLSLCVAVPYSVYGNRVKVNTVKAENINYTPYINLNGSIEEKDYEIVSQSDVVVSSVLVSKGDIVNKGQSVVNVNRDATAAMMMTVGNSNTQSISQNITSDYSGVVKSISVKSGDLVLKGDSILKLKGDGKLRVKAYVGESNASKIKLNQTAEISGIGFDGKYTARVSKIGESAKKITSGGAKIVVVEILLDIENADENIKSGFTSNVKLFTDDEKEITVLPHSAVCQDKEGEYVYVVKNETAQKRYVKTNNDLFEKIEIISGIKEGETVITNPQSIKRNGSLITIQNEVAAL